MLIQAPPRSGLYFFNYKKIRSIVVMSVVNSNYQFNMIDVGDIGRQSHGGVFTASNIGRALDKGLPNIHPPRYL